MVVLNLKNPKRINELATVFFQAIKPPPRLTVDEWADRFRVLTPEASSEPGPWRTSRFPFTREIMRELSPQSPATEVVLMCGSQVAKSEIALNKVLRS